MYMMGSTLVDNGKPHAVCMPFPAQGHIHGMIKLAKLLHFKGFHITYIHTEFNYNRILAHNPSSLKELHDFQFKTLPDGLPELTDDPNVSQDLPTLVNAVRTNLKKPLAELVRSLNDTANSGVPPVTCIVSDSFTSFTVDVANEFGIPVAFFCSASACGYMGCIQYEELVNRGLVPFKSDKDLYNGYLDMPLDWIAGMKNMRLRDLPTFLRVTDINDVLFSFIREEAQMGSKATAIIINTFDDLESSVIKAMSSILPPIYTVGPLTLLSHHIPNQTQIGSNNLWKEDTACLQWLDERKPESVIYVNFGSMALISHAQFIEFAWGLYNSGIDFLWVVRPDILLEGEANLPEEFTEKTKERGYVCTWCPQEDVLMHRAVGGFLTHCGWNSMMETISAGVPLICWPYFAEQQTNCRYACTEWGIGMEVDNDVKREEVGRMIRELMVGEGGKVMRRNALEWKEKMVRATRTGGSSFVGLDRAIEEVLGLKQI